MAAPPDTSSAVAEKLGIISGAGPDAGISLMQAVLASHRKKLGTRYKTDRDAPYITLFQVPAIGGPRGDNDLFDEQGAPFQLVWSGLTETIRKCDLNGLDSFCIACNTLHVLEGKIRQFCLDENIRCRLVSILDVVGEELKQCADASCKGSAADACVDVCILGTRVTTDIVLTEADKPPRSPYVSLLDRLETGSAATEGKAKIRRHGLDMDTRTELQVLIGSVKSAGPSGIPQSPQFNSHVQWFKTILNRVLCAQTASGAQKQLVFVLGCTELPLIRPDVSDLSTSESSLVVHFLDPGEVLCKRLVDVDDSQ
eukprot:TRINITY_DN48659_c0_g1_i1.p1 TRINITY_DN48659_c0_g1~~TRINITY_DN48659_c0_g1_i1.p1  ORF type:complete len:312 (+),score=39.04 TRINITY_DN48659_c0_g1_i1:58-993(+)